MTEHELLSPHATKAIEYLLAVSYLLLFIPFWRFVNGATVAQSFSLGWFQVPENVHLHRGHSWAKALGGAVAVGLDDFAHKMIGPLDAVELPAVGTALRQGQKAFTVVADGKPFDVLSPVDGNIVAVNEVMHARPAEAVRDPYGTGWLLKVEPRWLTANLKNLLSGDSARRFLDAAADALSGRMSPELGVVLQDGGAPVHGIAREIDPEHWDALVRRALAGE
jgi:glycine cleavage system H lipoate-binding protein